jgi:hypothetical protein
VVVVVLAVVAGNGLYLFHILNPNPLNLYSGLGVTTKAGYLLGATAVDPNSGITAQALGHLVALDWLHGHIAWWNPFEGLGAPLAGEMQSGVFFPPTLLLYFSDGQVYAHALVELVAGLSTYFLLARMGLGRAAALAGGVAFALNGTFAWFSHAPTNPICFLPLLLLGIEGAATTTDWRRSWSWVTIAVALALSVSAGFPEMAYCDGIVAAIWVVARAISLRRLWWPFVARVALGAVTGVLLAAPILVAFADYLHVGDVGGHSGAFANAALQHPALAQQITPYIFGPINAFNSFNAPGTLVDIWGNTGGFLSAAIIVLALIGLFGSRDRAVRIGLLAWIVLAMGRTYGVAPLLHIINALPAMKSVAFYRYSDPSWEMAVMVLAALGLDDVVRKLVPRWWTILCTAVTLLLVFLARQGARATLSQIKGVTQPHLWSQWSVVWALGITLVIGVIAVVLRGRAGAALLCALVCLDALGMFVVPTLSAPRAAHSDLGAVRYLQRHLGLARFYTFGPLGPNYGSYFGIQSLNANDLPVPKLFGTFVTHRLDTDADPLSFDGGYRMVNPGPTAQQEFFAHLSAFEEADVKYLVTLPDYALPPGTGLHRVYADAVDEVFELPAPQTLFKVVAGGGCFMAPRAIDTLGLLCHSPATIVRHELSMTGWTATVNGHAVSVKQDGAFQAVRVPKGKTVVQYTFAPPHLDVALLGSGLGVLMLIPLPMFLRLLRRRHRAAPDSFGRLQDFFGGHRE